MAASTSESMLVSSDTSAEGPAAGSSFCDNCCFSCTSSSSSCTCCSLPIWLSEALHFNNAYFMHPIMLGLVSAVAIVGTIAQLIGLNFWLSIDRKSPFTTAAVVAISWDIILLCIFAAWLIRKRHELGRFEFLNDRYVIIQLFIIGSLEAAGTLSVSYSALGTSEALQMLLKATVVPITAVFTIFVLKFDPGVTSKWGQLMALLRWESIAAVMLVVGAVAMLGFGGEQENRSKHHHAEKNISSSNATAMNGTAPSAGDDGDKSREDNRNWVWLVCLLGSVFNALHFVLQGNFMEVHTLEHDIFSNDDDPVGASQTSINASPAASGGRQAIQSSPVGSGGGPTESLPLIDDEDSCDVIGGSSQHHLAATPYVENANQRMSVDVVGGADFSVTKALHTGGRSPRMMGDHHEQNAAGGRGRGTNRNEADDLYKHDKWYREIAAKLLRSPYAVCSDDFTVKISMLFIDTFFQVVFTFMCLPFDAIHGFGPNENVADSWAAFSTGFKGIFHDSPEGTSQYFITFLCGFCSSHLAFAYLNHYSPTYTPMVMILASPITNIMLLIIPAWNSHPTEPVVWASLVSAVLMAAAAALFGRFEIMRKKRRISEMQKF